MFDAVALSLFGQTPQLKGGAKGDNTDSISWIMNELTGECWTELVFRLEPEVNVNIITQDGSCIVQDVSLLVQYKTPRRKLNRIDKNGNVLEVMTDSSTGKEYSAAFNKALRGMSYNDFQQTILLPQNGFTRFIKASNKDRVDLLEQNYGVQGIWRNCVCRRR